MIYRLCLYYWLVLWVKGATASGLELGVQGLMDDPDT